MKHYEKSTRNIFNLNNWLYFVDRANKIYMSMQNSGSLNPSQFKLSYIIF